ncbi:MAG: ArsR family transcriptional regulator [Luteimonas sp.]|nr:ArsR family transcriptional regulator [Luteimonas sp.]
MNTEKPFAERMREDRRLLLLRLLHEAVAYRANSSVLHSWLHSYGLASSRDDVNADLAWLKDRGYIGLEIVIPGVYVATLSASGMDVATGHAVVPGVSRPSPK